MTEPRDDRRVDSERLLLAIEAARIGIYVRDMVSDTYDADARTREIFGFTPDQTIRTGDVRDRVYPADQEAYRQLLSRVSGGVFVAGRTDGEFRVVLPGGEVRNVSVHIVARPDAGDKPFRVVGAVMDVTDRRRMEEEVRESRDRIALLLHSTDEGIFGIDREGRCTFVNESALRAIGRSLEECLGRDVHARVHHSRADGAPYPAEECPMLRAIRTGRGMRVRDEVFWRSDGSAFPVECSSFPMTSGGEIHGAVIAFSDITASRQAREELEESEKLLSQFISHSPIQAYIKTVTPGESRVLHASESFEEMVGVPGSLLLGKTMEEIFPPEFAARVTADDQAVASGSAVLQVEEELGGRSYTTIKFPIVLGARHLLAGYMIDVTDRRRAEAEVRQLASELERRVQERTAQLETANQELEAFSYSVSHDLRAPLRAIDGYSALLLGQESALDPEGRRLLGVVRKCALRMSQLIDDLLKFSRTGRSEIRPGRLEMTELARAAFEEVASGAGARERIELRLQPLPDAAGDAALVRQVWINLLSNAVKYTGRTERAVVEVDGEGDGPFAVYSVRDNGAGFDPAYAGRLFGVFQRLHRADEFEGTGIGLALVKRIVERHGGTVSADGALGAGATFRFSLPRA